MSVVCKATALLLASVFVSGASAADHPLEPLDLSSPRATLNSFLSAGDEYLALVSQEYWESPSRALVTSLHQIGNQIERTLDLSEVPPAARFEIGRDSAVYLYEVLSRIELPAAEDIPDAAAYTEAGDNKPADDKPLQWTLPHTEITLVRQTSGPDAGNFLFSPATVARAEEFYRKVHALPYRRDVPLQNYAVMRQYLSMSSAVIPPWFIEALPRWMKYGVYSQAVWKWIVLSLMVTLTFVIVWLVHRKSRASAPANSFVDHLRRLATPLTLIFLTPLVLDTAHTELTLTGAVSEGLTLLAEAVAYFSLAWIIWAGSSAAAEAFIVLPQIPQQSLNAHLLRLTARVVGVIAVIAIIFYVSNRLGAPLYGIVAGLGVGGIAIALAAQNTIEHFIGSLNLFADRPVKVGDLCRYGEDPSPEWQRVGIVESIGLRSTRVRGLDYSLTTIPNGDFSKMHLVNYSLRKCMLLKTVIGLRYETTEDQLRFVLTSLREMLLNHPRVVDRKSRVQFADFGDYSMNVAVRADVNTTDLNEFRVIREDINLRILKIVRDAGTGFAFPSRTVYFTRDEGLDAERQRAAEARLREWQATGDAPEATSGAGSPGSGN